MKTGPCSWALGRQQRDVGVPGRPCTWSSHAGPVQDMRHHEASDHLRTLDGKKMEDGRMLDPSSVLPDVGMVQVVQILGRCLAWRGP